MIQPESDGIIVINKPKDATSMDVVRLVKRVTRVKRVGHAGTLDPIATGVLPVCIGQATRFMEYLVAGGKTYIGEVTLGASTDTYDAYGAVTQRSDYVGITRADVEAQLPLFTGLVMQQPPMYSAVKHAGQRLYDLARAGVQVERPSREVVVHRLQLLEWKPPRMVIQVECGKGFYMRSLAHDLGSALGCVAHLSELARTKAGPFALDGAITVERMQSEEGWMDLLQTPDAALLDNPSVTLPASAERHVRNGQPVMLSGFGAYSRHLELRRAYSEDGRFLGLVRFNRPDASWKPEKIMAAPMMSRYASWA
jgi:tRNA pseudouridine55 synthase